MRNKRFNSKEGITLIALIITVIVLLILAGTAVSISINGGSIFEKANTAKEEWNRAVQTEEEEISEVVDILNELVKEPLTIPSSLETGDIVNWTPIGQYEWNKEYYTDSQNNDYENSTKMLYSGASEDMPSNTGTSWSSSNINMTISRWKVLSIDTTNKIVKLVPEEPTTAHIKLSGAQGYNNGVKLLNDACSALYGSASGVTARSINMIDLEGTAGDGSNGLMSADPNTVITAKGSGYPVRRAVEYSRSNSEHPTIYEEEALAIVDGVEVTSGVGFSEPANTTADENGFISKSNRIVTNKTIQPVETIYVLNYTKFSTALGSNESLILNNGASTNSFWVASRNIGFDDGFCIFKMWYINNRRFKWFYYVYF